MISLSLFPHIPPRLNSPSLTGAPANVIDRSIGCGRYHDGLGQALAASCGCVQYTQHTDLSLSLFRVAGIVVPRAQKQSENTPIPFVPFAFSSLNLSGYIEYI